jgi:hypothetical protein
MKNPATINVTADDSLAIERTEIVNYGFDA